MWLDSSGLEKATLMGFCVNDNGPFGIIKFEELSQNEFFPPESTINYYTINCFQENVFNFIWFL
jgi:hypothetical protein